MNVVFKLGDMVKIKKGTRFEGQFDGVGKIINVSSKDFDMSYRVRATYGYTNIYSDRDLEYYKITEWRGLI